MKVGKVKRNYYFFRMSNKLTLRATEMYQLMAFVRLTLHIYERLVFYLQRERLPSFHIEKLNRNTIKIA